MAGLWDALQFLPGAAAQNFGPVLERRREEAIRLQEQQEKERERERQERLRQTQEVATQLLIQERQERLRKGKEPEPRYSYRGNPATTLDELAMIAGTITEAETRAREKVESEFPGNRNRGGGPRPRTPTGPDAAPEALEEKLYAEAKRMISRGIDKNEVANWAARMDNPYRSLPRSRRLAAIQRAVVDHQKSQSRSRGGLNMDELRQQMEAAAAAIKSGGRR